MSEDLYAVLARLLGVEVQVVTVKPNAAARRPVPYKDIMDHTVPMMYPSPLSMRQ